MLDKVKIGALKFWFDNKLTQSWMFWKTTSWTTFWNTKPLSLTHFRNIACANGSSIQICDYINAPERIVSYFKMEITWTKASIKTTRWSKTRTTLVTPKDSAPFQRDPLKVLRDSKRHYFRAITKFQFSILICSKVTRAMPGAGAARFLDHPVYCLCF